MSVYRFAHSLTRQTPASWKKSIRPDRPLKEGKLRRLKGNIPIKLRNLRYHVMAGNVVEDWGRGPQRVHPFDRYGQLVSITADGASGFSLKCATILTPSFMADQRAQGRTRGGFASLADRWWHRLSLWTTDSANTTPWFLENGDFLILAEGSHPARVRDGQFVCMDNLGVLGAFDMFSAHPLRIGNRVFNIGLHPLRGIKIYEMDPNAENAQFLGALQLWGIPLVHSFAATAQGNLLIPVPPMFASWLKIIGWRLGLNTLLDSYQWDANGKMKIHVFNADSKKVTQTFEIGASALLHTINAYEEGDKIIFDYVHHDDFMETLNGVTSAFQGQEIKKPFGRIRRVILDRNTGDTTVTNLSEPGVEFPMIHPHFTGRRHQFIVTSAHAEKLEMYGSRLALTKVNDDGTSETTYHDFGDGVYAGEFSWVADPRRPQQEDSGFLVGTVYNANKDRTEFHIINVRDFRNTVYIASAPEDTVMTPPFHSSARP